MRREQISEYWARLRDGATPHVAVLRRQGALMRAALETRMTAAFMPDDATRKETQASIRSHVTAVALIGFFLATSVGVLGAMTHVAGAVIALGSLVVESMVRDGARVEAGTLLLRLDPTEAQANLSAVSKWLWELTARRARLEAERDDGETVAFPPDLQDADDADIARIMNGERKLFELRREAKRGQKAQLRERIMQLREEVSGLTEQAAAKAQEIEFVKKELGGVRDLYEKNLVPITRLTALERDAARLTGERGLLSAAAAQTRGKISEVELQVIQLDQNLRSEVAKELADIRAKMAELTEKKITAAEQVKRIDIRAPQAGVVQQLSVHATGAVVAAGEQIMLIVPEQDALMVEVKLNPADIDKVELSQHATLRFTSFNRQTTPELAGRVTRIAADTIKDDKAGAYYLVRVALDAGEVTRLGGRRLVAGMPVEAFISTSQRSMLSYLLKPLTDQASRAFREN
jgi:HlyD family secretion protein